MKIVAIIPCRYASTRFEGKPLTLILGKPMIQLVCEKAQQTEVLTDVVVATDDERIHECVKGFGGQVLI
jgi:3-deoxy-manno-octulosonate cytidylyltransferase (CMP-KDO synthetase)